MSNKYSSSLEELKLDGDFYSIIIYFDNFIKYKTGITNFTIINSRETSTCSVFAIEW